MPRITVKNNNRMSLWLRAARAVIEEADHVLLSERDSLRVLDLLKNPPAPNAKLLAAGRALPKRQ